ncbi:hypothetical protein CR492_14105 [Methylocella silvestris]|uniref:histidine kinase n=2 Tax=Methylocella silvestris TaxID=199596 RepID=A0A2J7TET9_METSI|nr:hypothetical protein CR492_14105 [Methylocella silvestris]
MTDSSSPPPARWMLSLRTQLILGFILIDLLAGIVCAAVIIVKARHAALIEMKVSVRLAEMLVAESVRLTEPHTPADRLLNTLAQQLGFIRHVRFAVFDANQQEILVDRALATDQLREREPAPAWFVSLIAPPAERHQMPIIAQHRKIGTVFIIEAPQDEVAEVWEDMSALAMIAFVANLAILGMLYLTFGRILVPLTRLSLGLSDLERQNFATRVAEPRIRELAEIVRRFNHLATALGETHGENRRLNQRLINLQDEERRRIALDLHDEFGPCFFGLSASLRRLRTIPASLRQPDNSKAVEMLSEQTNLMAEIIERMRVANRGILTSLRPMALGHVSLQRVLEILIADLAKLHAGISISLNAQDLQYSYSEPIDLTVYRCVQESVTNAIRHSTASTITIELYETEDTQQNAKYKKCLHLIVQDSGEGITDDIQAGFGLSGMKERIDALGGVWALANRNGFGARVCVILPI